MFQMIMHRVLSRMTVIAVSALFLTTSGCHVLAPDAIPQSRQYIAPELLRDDPNQIEIGRPIGWLDTAGWIWGIPDKLLLFDRRIDNHRLTSPTIETAAAYLHENHLPHVKVRLNQYAPLHDLRRLRDNKTVAWPYRYTLGLLAVGGEAVLPGRLFGGDHFNPFTQTVHLYSDVPAIALHELAHAKDFTRQKYQGSYGLAYLWMPAFHETIASRDVMAYLYERGDREAIIEANRILYPAYATYIGSGLGVLAPAQALPIYYGSVVAGHIGGRALSRRVDQDLRTYHAHFASSSIAAGEPGGMRHTFRDAAQTEAVTAQVASWRISDNEHAAIGGGSFGDLSRGGQAVPRKATP